MKPTLLVALWIMLSTAFVNTHKLAILNAIITTPTIQSDSSLDMLWAIPNVYHSDYPQELIDYDSQIFIGQQFIYASFSENRELLLTSVDTSTGLRNWVNNLGGIDHTGIFEIDNSVIVLTEVGIYRFDESGTLLWTQNDQRGMRYWEFKNVFLVDGILQIPTTGGVFQFALSTGEFEGELEVNGIFGWHGNYQITQIDRYILRVTPWSVTPSDSFFIELDPRLFVNAGVGLQHPWIRIINDVLIVCYETERVDIYDTFSGELLWSYNEPFYGIPALNTAYVIIVNAEGDIEFRDIDSGALISAWNITQLEDANAAMNFSTSFDTLWLSATDNLLVLRDAVQNQIFAVEIPSPSFS